MSVPLFSLELITSINYMKGKRKNGCHFASAMQIFLEQKPLLLLEIKHLYLLSLSFQKNLLRSLEKEHSQEKFAPH